MADTKLTALSAATSVSGSDLVYISQSATSKKATAGLVAAAFATSAFASLPSASTVSGQIYRVTDLSNALFISDGTIWKPVNGRCILACSAVAQSLTGSTSETTLASFTVPGGLMTANGSLILTTLWSNTNSANNKNLRIRHGATLAFSAVTTTAAVSRDERWIMNRNSASSQIVTYSAAQVGGFGGPTGTISGTVDTSADSTITFTGQLANSGENVTLNAYCIELVIA